MKSPMRNICRSGYLKTLWKAPVAGFQDMSQKLYTCNEKKRSSDSDDIACNYEEGAVETGEDVEDVPEVDACEVR